MESLVEITVGGPVANYHYYKNRQRCVKCHKQDAFTLNGHSYCYECAERDKAQHRARYDPIKNHDVTKAFRQRAIESGLCVNCRKPSLKGQTRCAECANKQRKATAAWRAKKKQVNLPRGDNGYCYICNKEKSDEGYKTCKLCRERIIENTKRGREQSNYDRGDHPWRKSNDRFYQKLKK